jgi:hypothetical protein
MPKKSPDDVSIGKFDILATYTYPGFLTRGMESGCLVCHRWNCTNHLRHQPKAAR